MTRSIYRYVVPADDQWHEIALVADPVAATVTSAGTVQFWAEVLDHPATVRYFRLYRTGDRLPEDAVWRATCQRDFDGDVWHLYERIGADRDQQDPE